MRTLSTRLALTLVAVAATIGLSAIQLTYASSSSPYWERSGSAVFYNDGNVGIGTNSPKGRLNVVGSSYLQGDVFFQGDNHSFLKGNAEGGIAMGHWGDAYILLDEDNNTNRHKFVIAKDGNLPSQANELFRVQENGFVGIGTNQPKGRLHVIGSSYLQGEVYLQGDEHAYIKGSVDRGLTLGHWENIYMLLDEDNNSSDGSFVVAHGANTPAEAQEVFRVDSQGNVKATGSVCDGSNNCLGNLSLSSYLRKDADIVFGGEKNIKNADQIIGYNDLRLSGNASGGVDLSITPNGDILWGSQGNLHKDQGASMELGGSGKPYIDFKNDSGDFDVRLMLERDDALALKGGNFLVEGTLKAKEIMVQQNVYADHVFDEDYNLLSLAEVEAHIRDHGHLPNVPSEAEVLNQPVSVAETQAKLLEKIEELTLYTLEQEERITALEAQLGNSQ